MDYSEYKLGMLLQQIYRFIGLSGIGWIIDFVILALFGLILENLFVASLISALSGASFVFFMSPNYLFKDNSKLSLKTRYVLYVMYQIVLIFFISYLLVKIDECLICYIVPLFPFVVGFTYLISKIIVTPIAMISNFLVLKYLIEKLTVE